MLKQTDVRRPETLLYWSSKTPKAADAYLGRPSRAREPLESGRDRTYHSITHHTHPSSQGLSNCGKSRYCVTQRLSGDLNNGWTSAYGVRVLPIRDAIRYGLLCGGVKGDRRDVCLFKGVLSPPFSRNDGVRTRLQEVYDRHTYGAASCETF